MRLGKRAEDHSATLVKKRTLAIVPLADLLTSRLQCGQCLQGDPTLLTQSGTGLHAPGKWSNERQGRANSQQAWYGCLRVRHSTASPNAFSIDQIHSSGHQERCTSVYAYFVFASRTARYGSTRPSSSSTGWPFLERTPSNLALLWAIRACGTTTTRPPPRQMRLHRSVDSANVPNHGSTPFQVRKVANGTSAPESDTANTSCRPSYCS